MFQAVQRDSMLARSAAGSLMAAGSPAASRRSFMGTLTAAVPMNMTRASTRASRIHGDAERSSENQFRTSAAPVKSTEPRNAVMNQPLRITLLMRCIAAIQPRSSRTFRPGITA
ncbi:hypothetical protein J2S68_003469 [Glycomyces algeriensis]|nr:hypothetical protein [Glycomyces algeriensis]